MLPATLNRHKSALFGSNGIGLLDSRGGTNIVRTRHSVTVHDILLFSIFAATLHICEPLHLQIVDAPGQAETGPLNIR
jgi:hypothetical protein